MPYHNGHPWFLELLIGHLCSHVYPRQPAAVARVTVVPAHGVLQSSNLRGEGGGGRKERRKGEGREKHKGSIE